MRSIRAQDIHAPSDTLRIFLFNVGQGDHIMLKFPDGEYGIIDFHYDRGIVEPPVLSYFKELKRILAPSEFAKVTISFFCISHTDRDHVKGISETVEWLCENGVFIRHFWLGAATDKNQLTHFLREKTKLAIDSFTLEERVKYQGRIDSFNRGIEQFFHYYERWQRRDLLSNRYSNEYVGNGEYLVDIKQLPRPCSLDSTEAVNMGPLAAHLEDYIKKLALELVKGILGIRDEKDEPDKNALSHILKIRFGDRNLLFGGDTGKEIWESCLAKYEDPQYKFIERLGPFESHFVKVSHHGSKYSSSQDIWKKVIPEQGAFLGISAGRHQRWKHPNSETLGHIREKSRDVSILSTNVCGTCIAGNMFKKEHHSWYDEAIDRSSAYGKQVPNNDDFAIGEIFDQVTLSQSLKSRGKGLFAFIFDVPANMSEEIEVVAALSSNRRSDDCFFRDHINRLHEYCGLSDALVGCE